MRHPWIRLGGLSLLTLLTTSSLWSQGQGASSSSGRPTSTSPTTPAPGRGRQSSRTAEDQLRSPVFVAGRILNSTGQAIPEPVPVELNCGMRPLQVIQTDLGGYFTFNLTSGMQSNIDFSASNQSPSSFAGPIRNASSGLRNSLTGCELRIAVPGYHPVTYTLTQHSDMGRIEVGDIRLGRIVGVKGSVVSVTSLLVPKDAREEFEDAVEEIQKNRPEKARPHLEKAIGIYDQYAAAWNELGRIHVRGGEKEKASEAFEKAIAADPDYIPPYLNLATMQLQEKQWEVAVQTAGTALELDPSVGFANFLYAVGNFNLNHLDVAEKSARAAEQAPHSNNAQVHALLAEIFLRKEAYPDAAVQMRTYLEESPEGQRADEMKKTLEELKKTVGDLGGESTSHPKPDS